MRARDALKDLWALSANDIWAALVRTQELSDGDIDEGLVRDLARHQARLDAQNADGLSVKTLFESHATYVEFSRLYTTNYGGYVQLLDRAGVSYDYRAAYDYCVGTVDPELGHEVFSYLCFVALCSTDPVQSFVRCCAWTKRHMQLTGDQFDLDVERLIHDCCGPVYLGSPVEHDWSKIASSMRGFESGRKTVRAAVEQGALLLHEVFQRPQAHLERLAELARPAVVFRPLLSGGFPALPGTGGRTHLQLILDLSFSASYRALESLEAFQDTPAAPSTWELQARPENLRAAHRGDVDALFNLGCMSDHAGLPGAARAWWRLAASEGDQGALRALGLLCASEGQQDAADRWLDIARWPDRNQRCVPLPAGALLALGRAMDAVDSDCALECYRRSFFVEGVTGALLYGERVVADDPVDGLVYLTSVAGATPVDPETAVASARAAQLIREMQRRWGFLASWKYLRQCRKRLEALIEDDT